MSALVFFKTAKLKVESYDLFDGSLIINVFIMRLQKLSGHPEVTMLRPAQEYPLVCLP